MMYDVPTETINNRRRSSSRCFVCPNDADPGREIRDVDECSHSNEEVMYHKTLILVDDDLPPRKFPLDTLHSNLQTGGYVSLSGSNVDCQSMSNNNTVRSGCTKTPSAMTVLTPL